MSWRLLNGSEGWRVGRDGWNGLKLCLDLTLPTKSGAGQPIFDILKKIYSLIRKRFLNVRKNRTENVP
jgi:hypothetical protein